MTICSVFFCSLTNALILKAGETCANSEVLGIFVHDRIYNSVAYYNSTRVGVF